jgi:hypothetical protein
LKEDTCCNSGRWKYLETLPSWKSGEEVFAEVGTNASGEGEYTCKYSLHGTKIAFLQLIDLADSIEIDRIEVSIKKTKGEWRETDINDCMKYEYFWVISLNYFCICVHVLFILFSI